MSAARYDNEDNEDNDRLYREPIDRPLREQLFPERAAAERAVERDAAGIEIGPRAPVERLQFTGEGAEYFRIWVVNLLLTVLTFGVYSAWAKVRKTRYFNQNTRLNGHVFDYHGPPAAILRGRLLALLLLAAYTWSFDISRTAGLVTIAVLCLVGPWLFMKAQQFRYRNTSWRGLRFGFDAQPRAAYLTLLPLLVIWFSGTVAGVTLIEDRWLIGAIGIGSLLLFPWMHHALKRYQHERIRYGREQASFEPATAGFYGVYGKSIFLLIAAGATATLVGVIVATVAAVLAREGGAAPQVSTSTAMITGFVFLGVVYLMLWPYYAARLQKIVWANTQLGPVRFATHIRAAPLAKLVFKSVMLTLLTAGLYWPFAAVALARYRVQCMEVIAPAALSEVVAGVSAPAPAAGEGAVDLFGLDVGL